MKVPEYISDKIGKEYQNWGKRDIILITAPTGTGKSHFILHIFLKWIIRKNERILYLVNRKILKKQLEKELREEVEDEIYKEMRIMGNIWQNYITISTYQSIEKGLKGEKQSDTIQFIQGFNSVVCDECHYFYSDSNFNTSTELSYFVLKEIFSEKLQIYVSATPDKIKENINQYLNKEREILEYKGRRLSYFNRTGREIKEYSVEDNYDYIELSVFEKIEDLIDIIRKNVNVKKQKWLIFVDSIDIGKDLQSKLLKRTSSRNDDTKEDEISTEDVIFLDAQYKKEEDTRESVEEIAKEKISSKKVVISTAVMDNGVSFHDLELRNIVILADTKETFLQMLGRKRKDGCKVKLYICKQNVEHFEKRQQHIERVLEFYDGYIDKLKYIKNCICKKREWETLNKCYYIAINNILPMDCYRCFANQQDILNELLTNHISGRYIKEFCYSLNGILIPNMFSIPRYWDLKIFYKDIIKKLENDEYAFIRQQAAWLSIPEEKLESIIQDFKKSDYEKNRKNLEQAIEKVLDKPMNRNENIDWKLSIQDILLYFIKKNKEFKEGDVDEIKRNDRTLSSKIFERCVKQAELPYKMEMKKGNQKRGKETSYTISRESQEQERVESKN